MAITGWYGKLPALGDFASRRLPQDFIQSWDDWLQRELAESQTILGEAWLECYLTSHIWRFVLTQGCLDSRAWAGILVPSVDRVGRYFPLCLAMQTEPDNPPSPLWFDTLEACARAALGGADVETFEAALAAQPSPQPSGDDVTVILPSNRGNVSGSSFWFTGSFLAPEHCLRVPGMPDAQAYVSMLKPA